MKKIDERMSEAERMRVRGRGTDRLLDILDHLERSDQPITVKELSEQLEAPKSTIYLLVELLVERNYLEASPNGRYQIGPRLGRLGMAFGRRASFPLIVRQALRELASRTGVIAELVVVDNWMQFVMFAAVDEGNPYLKSSEGARFPLPHTASARFLLRDVSPDIILKNIPESHYHFLNGSRISPKQFLKDIKASRSRETYSTRGIVDPHLSCIATPVFAPDGLCVAALSLVMPLTEIDGREAELNGAILEAGRALTDQLKTIPFSFTAPFKEGKSGSSLRNEPSGVKPLGGFGARSDVRSR